MSQQYAGVFVNAILVLDSTSGARIHAKYFASEFAGAPEKQLEEADVDGLEKMFFYWRASTDGGWEYKCKIQLAFEKKLHAKSVATTEVDVMLLEGSLVVYTMGADIFCYVVGSVQENEIILQTVLEAFVGTLRSVLKGHLDKHTILDNLELLLLTVDEIVDAGTVLETDSSVLSKRVMLRNPDGSAAVPTISTISNPAELTFSSAFNIAKEGFAKFTRS